MLPAIEEIDNQMVNDGHTSSFQPHVSVLSDVGRNAQGRDPSSDAAVNAFVDDLFGSAPSNIVDRDDEEQFSDRVSSFVNIYTTVLQKRGV